MTNEEASTTKVQQSTTPLTRVLLAAPRLRDGDRAEIEARVHQSWASGLNVYHANILALVRTCFVLLDERWRVQLLRDVGDELDSKAEHQHRQAWHTLLSQLAET